MSNTLPGVGSSWGQALPGNIVMAAGKTVDTLDLSKHPLMNLEAGQNLYYPYHELSVTRTTKTPAGNMQAARWWWPGAITFVALGVDVATAAVGTVPGTKVMRLGFYVDTSYKPVALTLDAGTISTATTGIKIITGLSQVLGPGDFWVVVLDSNEDTTQTVIRASNNILGFLGENSTNNEVRGLYYVAQASGALPDPFTAGGGYASLPVPLIFFRV